MKYILLCSYLVLFHLCRTQSNFPNPKGPVSEVDWTQNDPGEGPRHVAVILLLYYGSVSFVFLPLVPHKLTSIFFFSRSSEIEDCHVSVCSGESHAPPAKKMKVKDGVEEEIIKCIKDIRERRDRKQAQENEDDHFGRHVAAVMNRLQSFSSFPN